MMVASSRSEIGYAVLLPVLYSRRLDLSRPQHFLRFRLQKFFRHFVPEISVYAPEPKRLLPVVLFRKNLKDFLHDRKRLCPFFELQGIKRIKIDSLVGHSKDQSSFLPSIRLGAWISLAEMSDFSDVCGLGKIVAL